MLRFLRYFLISLLIVAFAFLPACGSGSEQEQAAEKKTETTPTVTGADKALPLTSAPFAEELKTAGFEPAYYTRFPATIAGKDGRLILYRSATGGGDGGMIFAQEAPTRYEWVWHWYFGDISPEKVEKIEINQDGLWDILLIASGGKRYEFVQDEAFTFGGGERRDRIALNGESSETLPGMPLWHCFDNNHNTSWMSPVDGDDPFIEIHAPFGLADGIISLTALEDHQPRQCVIEADGNEIQSFELKSTMQEQLIHLEPAAMKAGRIRIVFRSCYGDAKSVAIAELSIR